MCPYHSIHGATPPRVYHDGILNALKWTLSTERQRRLFFLLPFKNLIRLATKNQLLITLTDKENKVFHYSLTELNEFLDTFAGAYRGNRIDDAVRSTG